MSDRSTTPPVRRSDDGAARILTIVQDLGPGGTQRSAENNAIAYRSAGRGSAVLARFRGGDRAQRIGEAGCPVFIADPEKGETDPALIEQIAAWNPSVIQFHRHGHTEPSCGALLRAIAQQMGHRVPTAELSHFGRCDRSADRFLFDVHMQLSGECLRRWRNWTRGLRPGPVGVTVPHMVDTERFFEASPGEAGAFREAHGIPRDAFVFVRVGQPHPYKWTGAVVDAFGSIAGELPDAWLVLVGAPGAVVRRVEGLPGAVRERVVLIEFLNGDEALRACYTASDLFVLTSCVGETFGLVLAESMACGTPCLTVSTPTKDNSQGGVVGHDDAGVVLASESLLAGEMLSLARDRSRLSRLASRARARVLERFHRDTVIDDALFVLDATARHAGDPDALRAVLGARAHLMPDARTLRRDGGMIGSHTVKDRVVSWAKETPMVYRVFYLMKSAWMSSRGMAR